MSKKNLNILIGISLFILLGILIYFFFFFNKDQEPGADNDLDGEGLPIINFPDQDSDGDPLIDGDDPFEINFDNEYIKQITQKPVSGFSFNLTESQNEEILFTERINGHINKTSYDNNDEIIKISNTTIPKVYESYFVNNNQKILYQILDENNQDIIKTYFADVNKVNKIEDFGLNPSSSASTTTDSGATSTDESATSTTPETDQNENNTERAQTGTLSGNFLLDNIKGIVKMSNEKLFLLFNQKAERNFRSFGVIFDTKSQNEYNTVFQSEFSDIIANKINNTLVGITTRPTYKESGFSWVFNTENQSQELILGPVYGLNVNYSPDGKKVLYSSSKGNQVRTYLYDMEESKIYTFPVNTLPQEKCTWNNGSNMIYCAIPLEIQENNPDSWYKGRTQFEDFLISYDLGENEMEFIYDNKYRLDITDIILSPEENFLLFKDKKDLSLWAFDLREIKSILNNEDSDFPIEN